MIRRSVVALSSLLGAFACGSPPAASKSEAAPQAVAEKPEERERGVVRPQRDGVDRGTRVSKQDALEIVQAYAAGTLGDRLVADEMLLVDAKAPQGTDQTQYFLLPATYAGPTSTGADLRAAVKEERETAKRVTVGGDDGDRPGLFRKVAAGKYLACAAVGPRTSPEKLAYRAATKAAMDSAPPGESDAARMSAAIKKAQAETGYVAEKIAWETVAARCQPIEVTGEASSRVVVLAPPAATP